MSVWMCSLAAIAAIGGQEPVLKLDEALKIAEANAFSVKLAESGVIKSQQLLRENRSLLEPRINSNATYTRFDKAITTSFGSGTATVRPIDSSSAAIALTMPLLASKAVSLGLDYARYNIKASEASLAAAKSSLRLNVRQAYYRTVQARWQVGVAKEAIANAEKRLANAQIREKAGELAKIDVLRFQTELAQRRGDLIAAQNGLELSKSSLNNILGRPIETSFETEEIESQRPRIAAAETLFKLAEATRPEIQALRMQAEAFSLIRRIEGHGLDPTLNLTVTHTRNLGTLGFGGTDASTTGIVALSFPLYDSGMTRARTKAAAEDEAQAKLRLQQSELGVSLEVRQAMTSLSNAISQMDTASQQEALASETYRLSVVRYEAGEGIQLEVIDAQTQLTAAQTALAAARYSVLIAYAQLQAAVGTDALPSAPTPTNGENK